MGEEKPDMRFNPLFEIRWAQICAGRVEKADPETEEWLRGLCQALYEVGFHDGASTATVGVTIE